MFLSTLRVVKSHAQRTNQRFLDFARNDNLNKLATARASKLFFRPRLSARRGL
jgi:hypothetical protein